MAPAALRPARIDDAACAAAAARPGPRPGAGRGFTLVELLVALVALSLLAVMSWRGIDAMVRTQAQTAAHSDDVLALQTALTQWTADLDAVVRLPQGPALEWNGRVLRMTRRGTVDAAEGLRVVGWARRDGWWLRWQSPPVFTRGELEAAWTQADLWAANPSDAQRRLEVRVAAVSAWQLFFFRGDSWTNPQSSQGEAPAIPGTAGPLSEAPPLPDGVRLVLELPPGQALAGRLTRDWVNPALAGGRS